MCMQFLTPFAKKYPNKGPCFYLALEWMQCWYKNAKVLHILPIFSKNWPKIMFICVYFIHCCHVNVWSWLSAIHSGWCILCFFFPSQTQLSMHGLLLLFTSYWLFLSCLFVWCTNLRIAHLLISWHKPCVVLISHCHLIICFSPVEWKVEDCYMPEFICFICFDCSYLHWL